MNKIGYIKYKIFKLKKPEITNSYFSELIRTKKQDYLIKIIKQSGIKVEELDINWDYISKNDKLNTNFIIFFKDFINFNLY